jgi:hypothetical protein
MNDITCLLILDAHQHNQVATRIHYCLCMMHDDGCLERYGSQEQGGARSEVRQVIQSKWNRANTAQQAASASARKRRRILVSIPLSKYDPRMVVLTKRLFEAFLGFCVPVSRLFKTFPNKCEKSPLG